MNCREDTVTLIFDRQNLISSFFVHMDSWAANTLNILIIQCYRFYH